MHDEGDGGVHEDDTWDHQKAAILKFRLCEGDIIGKVIAGINICNAGMSYKT